MCGKAQLFLVTPQDGWSCLESTLGQNVVQIWTRSRPRSPTSTKRDRCPVATPRSNKARTRSSKRLRTMGDDINKERWALLSVSVSLSLSVFVCLFLSLFVSLSFVSTVVVDGGKFCGRRKMTIVQTNEWWNNVGIHHTRRPVMSIARKTDGRLAGTLLFIHERRPLTMDAE